MFATFKKFLLTILSLNIFYYTTTNARGRRETMVFIFEFPVYCSINMDDDDWPKSGKGWSFSLQLAKIERSVYDYKTEDENLVDIPLLCLLVGNELLLETGHHTTNFLYGTLDGTPIGTYRIVRYTKLQTYERIKNMVATDMGEFYSVELATNKENTEFKLIARDIGEDIDENIHHYGFPNIVRQAYAFQAVSS